MSGSHPKNHSMPWEITQPTPIPSWRAAGEATMLWLVLNWVTKFWTTCCNWPRKRCGDKSCGIAVKGHVIARWPHFYIEQLGSRWWPADFKKCLVQQTQEQVSHPWQLSLPEIQGQCALSHPAIHQQGSQWKTDEPCCRNVRVLLIGKEKTGPGTGEQTSQEVAEQSR